MPAILTRSLFLLHMVSSSDDDLMLDDVRPLRNRLILKSDKSRTRVIPQVQNHNLEDYRWILKEHIGLDVVMQKPKFLGLRKMSKAFNYFLRSIGRGS